MLNYANDTWMFCIQLTKGPGSKREIILPGGKKEIISDEDQLDRIFARSEKYVMTPKGLVKGKQAVVQEYKFHNPYVLVLLKVVSEEDANLIREYNELDWNDSISEMKDRIAEYKNVTKKPINDLE